MTAIFGNRSAIYGRIVNDIAPDLTKDRYTFEDLAEFERKSRDEVAGREYSGRVYWTEMPYRAHMASVASVFRTTRWMNVGDATFADVRPCKMPDVSIWILCLIERRPEFLLDDNAYRTLPKAPLAVDWSHVPELIRIAMLDLGGVQPPTLAMAKAAGDMMRDKPSEGEIALFRERGTMFQLVSVVLSCVAANEADGHLRVRPFAVTLIPGSKRNEVDERPIDAIAPLDVSKWLAADPLYTGYDPFSGEWSMYGNMPGYLDGKREGFLDEIGLVVDQYFLATEVPEDDEILVMDLRMPTEQMRLRYERHRKKLLFTPFKKVETRRVWGAETPIELFLLQALAGENLFPQCQMLIMDDGSVFPSWYHLWQDIEFRHSAGLVTEADMFFPDERVAIFCDGGFHSRGKQKAKDAAINEKLASLGIRAVRIPGNQINTDLQAAVEQVRTALAEQR